MNGSKGPNTVGKDIGFISALYAMDPVIVAPIPLALNAKNGSDTTMEQTEASAACTAQDADSRLPNKDELSAMFYNRELVGIDSGEVWSSSVLSDSRAWDQSFWTGVCYRTVQDYPLLVRCIKR